MPPLLRICLIAAVAGTMIAQAPTDWQAATDLPGLDFSGLTAAQKTAVLKILREEGCPCGCSMQLAECRTEDPACTYSKGLSALAINTMHEEKTADQVMVALKASPLAKGPTPRPILEAPVKIPIDGPPPKEPEKARSPLLEFSSFE